MKDKIEITKSNNQLKLYLVCNGHRIWLFTQDYSMSVYEYFKKGRSLREVMNYKDWAKGPRLNKTIERLPGMIKYVKNEYGLNEQNRKHQHRLTRRTA